MRITATPTETIISFFNLNPIEKSTKNVNITRRIHDQYFFSYLAALDLLLAITSVSRNIDD